MGVNGTDSAPILMPDGSVPFKVTVYLSPEEAAIIRAYERWLKKARLQRPEGVGVYCAACFEANRRDGTKYFVEPERILIECRCTTRIFQGATL